MNIYKPPLTSAHCLYANNEKLCLSPFSSTPQPVQLDEIIDVIISKVVNIKYNTIKKHCVHRFAFNI